MMDLRKRWKSWQTYMWVLGDSRRPWTGSDGKYHIQENDIKMGILICMDILMVCFEI